MLLRSAALTTTALGLALFTAGAATGFGLGVGVVAAACVGRKALRKRAAWRDGDTAHEASFVAPVGGDDALPDAT